MNDTIHQRHKAEFLAGRYCDDFCERNIKGLGNIAFLRFNVLCLFRAGLVSFLIPFAVWLNFIGNGVRSTFR